MLGGLALFFARNGVHHAIPNYMSTPMVSVLLLGILGSFLTSYTRARAEGLGIDASVGMLPAAGTHRSPVGAAGLLRPRVDGWVLMVICVVLTVTAWITVIQRVAVRVPGHVGAGIAGTRRVPSYEPRRSATEVEAYDARNRR